MILKTSAQIEVHNGPPSQNSLEGFSRFPRPPPGLLSSWGKRVRCLLQRRRSLVRSARAHEIKAIPGERSSPELRLMQDPHRIAARTHTNRCPAARESSQAAQQVRCPQNACRKVSPRAVANQRPATATARCTGSRWAAASATEVALSVRAPASSSQRIRSAALFSSRTCAAAIVARHEGFCSAKRTQAERDGKNSAAGNWLRGAKVARCYTSVVE